MFFTEGCTCKDPSVHANCFMANLLTKDKPECPVCKASVILSDKILADLKALSLHYIDGDPATTLIPTPMCPVCRSNKNVTLHNIPDEEKWTCACEWLFDDVDVKVFLFISLLFLSLTPHL
jgi:RNA polymerase subunit RPABC4/transcription elongation factor Spt4